MRNFPNEFFKGTVANEKAFKFGKITKKIYIELGGVVVANDEIFNSFKLWFANEMKINGYYSKTTMKHLNVFLVTCGFDKISKAELATYLNNKNKN